MKHKNYYNTFYKKYNIDYIVMGEFMKILDIYHVNNIEYKNKDSLMIYKNFGKVESTKIFPVFCDKLFKPLSKTKPLTTPLFAYSEVFWSYYVQKYFEHKAFRYSLAKCPDIEDEIEKAYPIGTLVPKANKENQKLVNLLEYFKKYPDSNVDIDNYINYCEKIYDYTDILKAKIFQERDDLRHSLENQILLSILKQDENFHYENISFIVEDDKILELCPTLDSEFSLMFLYPDNQLKLQKSKNRHNNSLSLYFSSNSIEALFEKSIQKEYADFSNKVSLKNCKEIIRKDTYIVQEFLKKLDLFIEDISTTDILFYNDNFFDKLSSDAWLIGYSRYKDKNEKQAQEFENSITYNLIDEKNFNISLKEHCLESAKNLKFNLEILLYLNSYNLLDDATIEKYLELNQIDMNEDEFNKLTIDDKLKLIKLDKCKKYIY
jgi:hypothetical protein